MDTRQLKRESLDFRKIKDAEHKHAMQRAALQILCGLDLDAVMNGSNEARAAICLRIKRLIERERIRGQSRHWSYDLNRHIALKQAFDNLSAAG
ncbi:MAG: cytoplasmic protein [Phyllobacterium sp.]